MNKIICDEFLLDTIEMREAYCNALIAEAKKNDKIYDIEVDVQSSMGTKAFKDIFPNRSINCGIMEAHAIGLCAGMSATGLIPFFHAFGVFASRRVYDQVFLFCAYQDLNVKIIGGDSGINATANGGTHMPFEDVGIMRNIPNITIVEPADSAILETLVATMANTYGNFYVRSSRKKGVKIYTENTKFEIGKANTLTEGKDVAIIASGLLVHQALLAERILRIEGITCRVIDMHTIKPIDKDTIIKAAIECGAIVTAENHNIINGLGSAVAEVVVENILVPVERIGVNDEFGQVGTLEYLMEIYKLRAQDICEKVRECIRRKRL